MGHIRLGALAKTLRWKHVIQLLEEGADLSTLAQASFQASLTGLKRIPDDPGFNLVLTDIFKFVEAARSKDFAGALRDRGFQINGDVSTLSFVSSLHSKIDHDLSAERVKSDVSEIAQNAFAETLLSSVSLGQRSLFQSTSADLHRILSKALSGKQFGVLMHEFYTTFTHRYLSYHLSREFPLHVGAGQYFDNLGAHQRFNESLNLFIRQTVRISDEFTPGWLGKAIHKGTLDSDAVSRYAHVSFKKIAGEFQRGGE